MIYYLATRSHSYTMAKYLGSWGRELSRVVRVVPYGALPANRDLPSGTYVFSDLERLNAGQRALVGALREALARADGQARLLNDPARSLRRLALLQRLHERGVNRFNAFHPGDPGRPWRYPVFVREENQHTGSLTGLLRDEASLAQALLLLTMEGYDLGALLVVEFCETADAVGLYRKYSAFRVGDRVFPRHVLFSRNWVLKDYDLQEPAHLEELHAYGRTNPHEAELRGLFELAGVHYGRIDYSLVDGVIQVWEINTNPLIARPPEEYPAVSLGVHEAFAAAFNEAFARLDSPVDPRVRIPIAWSPERAFEG